ncbi:putative zinc finger, CCHC-type containing protein [Tanacetum coccineum]
MKNLKNQLQDVERQHKQKRITSLIDDPWRLPSTPFVEQRKAKPSTRKEPTFSQESQSIADVSQKDCEEFDNVESFEHLFMAEQENAKSTVQFDAEEYEEHQENLNQETPTKFPKSDIKQYFTFDDVPLSKWHERSIEMLTWCTVELQYYTIDVVIKRFLTRLQGRLRDWYHSLGEYRQLQIQQSISHEAFMSIIYSEFIGSPWEHTTYAREEFLKMKCCSFQKKDLDKHYDRMYLQHMPFQGVFQFFEFSKYFFWLQTLDMLQFYKRFRKGDKTLHLEEFFSSMDCVFPRHLDASFMPFDGGKPSSKVMLLFYVSLGTLWESLGLGFPGVLHILLHQTGLTSGVLVEATTLAMNCESCEKDGVTVVGLIEKPTKGVDADDKFPLPQKKSLFQHLADAKILSKFDLKSGFWQLGIKPEDRPKTAFCIPDHHYQWKVMPFGLKNAPSAFQKAMITIFEPILANTLVYIDDILLFSPDEQSHAELLSKFYSLVAKYKSGTFKASEQHYHSTFKEILAVKRGIEKFQFHLIGHEFQVEMDMSSFPRMLQFKRKMIPHAQLLRWSNWFSQ